MPVHDIVACGGLAEKSPLMHADLRRRHRAPVPASAPPTRRRRSARPCSGRSPPARRPAATPPSGTRRARWPGLKDDVYEPVPANRERLRRPLPRVRPPPRLLRPRRERRHEGPARPARAGQGPDVARGPRPGAGLTMRLEALRAGAGPAPPGAAALRAGRLDRRQRQRPRPGDRARRDQAVRRPLRGPHRRVDGRARPRRDGSSRGRCKPSSDTASHLVHLPPRART